jgi:hypothetical protein
MGSNGENAGAVTSVLSTVAVVLPFLFLALVIFGFVRSRRTNSGVFLRISVMGFAASILWGGPFWPAFIDSPSLVSLTGNHANIVLHNSIGNVFVLAPLFGFLALVLVGFANRNPSERRSFIMLGSIGAPVAFVFALMLFPYSLKPIPYSREHETKANLRSIQHALEIYSKEHDGNYPENIELLLDDVITRFPLNAYNGSPFRNVSYGSPDFEGNFTYLPLKVDGNVRGYYLLAYGDMYVNGVRLLNPDVADHVILVLDSETGQTSRWPPGVPFPDIRNELVKGLEPDTQ